MLEDAKRGLRALKMKEIRSQVELAAVLREVHELPNMRRVEQLVRDMNAVDYLRGERGIPFAWSMRASSVVIQCLRSCTNVGCVPKSFSRDIEYPSYHCNPVNVAGPLRIH